MRVCICSSIAHKTPPEAYGSEVTAWYMAEELSRRGHSVHLIAAEGSKKPPVGELHVMGKTDLLNLKVETESAFRFLDVMNSCDVVHDMSNSHIFADVNHERGHDRHLSTISGISFFTPIYKHNVVVLSRAAREAALKGTPAWPPEWPQFHTSPGRLPSCRFVHYGTDTEFYRPSPSKEDYAVYIGRPHPSKGTHKILQLAHFMPEQRFILAWRAEYPEHKKYEAQYVEYAKKLSNVEIVKLPLEHHHEEKRAFYQHAKTFIQPTEYIEAFGLCFIEALACGTPVITTPKGSAPEVVKHGETGFLCNDLKEMAEAIRRVDQINPKRCREDAVLRFDKSVMADGYLQLYGEVMNGGRW